MADLFVVVGGAVFLALVSLWVYRRNDGEVSLNEFVGYLSFQVVVIFVILLYTLPKSKFNLLLMLPLLLPNFAILAGIVGGFFGKNTIGKMFFPQMDKPVKNKLGGMKSLLWDENIPGAVKACLDQFEQYPDEYDILLDGAALLCDRGSYLEALNTLQKASTIFHEDSTVWSQVTYQAATIRMDQLDDKEQACALFRRIAERMPDSEVGRRARERMYGDSLTVKHPEEGQWIPTKQMHQHEEKGAQKDADPFYRKRSEKPRKENEEPPTPAPPSRSLEDEMPGMFLDDDTKEG